MQSLQYKLRNLTLELTNQCNLRCKMCGIWAEPHKDNLSISDIKKILNLPLFEFPIGSVSLTGGECFMHPDFDVIFKLLSVMHIKHKISNIHIVTNGYLTEDILHFLSKNKRYISGLEMTFSIDGLEKNHTFQRGVNDAFTRTISTILKIREEFPEVRVGVKFTINKLNYPDILPIY